MSEDIKVQLFKDIKEALFGLFAIQLDESTDVPSMLQLICFVRYATHNSIKDCMLFGEPLEMTRKQVDVKKKVVLYRYGSDIS